MLRKMYFLVGAIAIMVAILAAVRHTLARAQNAPTNAVAISSIPTRMYIHGYTGYPDDWEHCFLRHSGRALDFDAYVDVRVKDEQIDLKLYTFEKGFPELVDMKRGTGKAGDGEWYVKYNRDKKFTVEIKPDARPHLGPGPYTALMPISSVGASGAGSKFIGFYPYGTWPATSSPLDCFH
jgi:hypothetical protein